MISPELAKEATRFQINYYHWAQGEWEREVNEDLPIIRAIPNLASAVLLRFLEPLPRSDILRMAKALVKRAHPFALKSLSEELSVEETELLRGLDQCWRQAGPSIGLEFWARESQREPAEVRRNKLREAIRGAIEPLAGDKAKAWARNEWRYRTRLGRWTIVTYIDFGGSAHDLVYHHDIEAGSQQYLARFVSALMWLGVAGQTSWTLLRPSEYSDAAGTLAGAWERFLDAAPSLLPT
jgi:hypothetical protein